MFDPFFIFGKFDGMEEVRRDRRREEGDSGELGVACTEPAFGFSGGKFGSDGEVLLSTNGKELGCCGRG
jgi:hypothetical protein